MQTLAVQFMLICILQTMAPFRWPLVQNDIDLAIAVDAARPEKSSDWDVIAAKLIATTFQPQKSR